MIRASWKGALLAALASAGVAWGQSPSLPTRAARPAEKVVTVQEKDGLPEPCRLLKTWTTDDGRKAFLLEVLDSGERLTVVQKGGARPGSNQVGATIYRWGNGDAPPKGSPVPPPEGAVCQVAHATEAPEPRPPAGTPRPAPAPAVGGILPATLAAAAADRLHRVTHTAEAPELRPPAAPLFGDMAPRPAPGPRFAEPAPSAAPAVTAAPAVGCARGDCEKGQGHCGYVHHYEKPPHLYFVPGGCLPVCTPEHCPTYGYYPTQWHPWPGGAEAGPPTGREEAPGPGEPRELLPAPKVSPAMGRPAGTGRVLAP